MPEDATFIGRARRLLLPYPSNIMHPPAAGQASTDQECRVILITHEGERDTSQWPYPPISDFSLLVQ